MNMIKIKYIAAGFALLATLMASARTLTPDEALARLQTGDMPAKAAPLRVAKQPSQLRLAKTQATENGTPAVYVFERTDRKGYLVLSADDSAQPLLGYSDSGSFPEQLPPAMQWWLEEYARQIEFNTSNQSAITMPRKEAEADERKAIEPMLKTNWDQDAPYNSQCPKYGSVETYTGCVATAMAQVMKYWEYPKKGRNKISYNASTIGRRLSLDFSLKEFDWANMIDEYEDGRYNQQQADAVAYLMKACGYSVKMDYGTDSSGALAMNISSALTHFFNYDGNIDYQLRAYYGAYEWEQMIYDNLNEVGPILYGGTSTLGGGHSFVCDGYDGNGYFHFNWGWTGMSNGYFSLDVLNPGSLGIGGGSGGGYNFTQDAVFGIQPPTGKPVVEKEIYMTQHGSLAGYISNDSLKIDLFAENQAMWVNYNPSALKVRFGGIIQSDNGGETTNVYFGKINFTINPGYGTDPKAWDAGIYLPDLNLPDGKYRLTAATQSWTEDNAPWIPVRPVYGCYNYITLTKAEGKYSVEVNDVDRLMITDGSVVGDLYYGMTTTVEVSVVNESDHEMTKGYAPVIVVDGQPALIGESIYLTVGPGKTETRSWTTFLYSLQQYFSVNEDTPAYLTFYDEGTYEVFSDDIMKPVMLKPNPGAPRVVTSGAPRVTNAESSDVGDDLQVNYSIVDKHHVNVSAKVRLMSGIFGYTMYACLVDDDGMLVAYNGYNVSMTKKNQLVNFSTTLDCANGVSGKTYALMMAYAYGSNMVQIGPGQARVTFKDESAGIDNVGADGGAIVFIGSEVVCADADIEIFNTQGAKVAEAHGSVDTSSLQAGVYVARAGARTLKFVVR